MTYAEASAQLAGPRNRDSRKIAPNTYIERRGDGSIALNLYHKGDIMTYFPNGDTRYNPDGWYGNLPKLRMNQFGPKNVYVQSEYGQWMLTLPAPENGVISDPGYYYGQYCHRCRKQRRPRAVLGKPLRCQVCGFRYADYKYYRAHAADKRLCFMDGMIVHPDLSVTGAGPVVHYKQYSNHHDLLFGIFAEKSANV